MFRHVTNLLATTRPHQHVQSLRKMSKNTAAVAVSSNRVTVGGCDLHYNQAGTGPLTVLCLPGALGTGKRDFTRQLSGLAGPELTLIAWDPPGYGRSRPPDRYYGHDFLLRDADMAAKMMQQLGHGSYSLLGWSDGGITALMMAGTEDSAVDKLVVWGSNAFVGDEDVQIYEGIRDVSAWSPRMRAPMEELYGANEFKKLWEGWVDALTDIHRLQDGELCRDQLPAITAPCLIIHGRKDAMMPESHAHYLAQHIPGATLEFMDNGKHNLHMKYADIFNKRVQDFLLDGK